jgi:predicted GIY-YIG superfamily endonuclease
MTLAIYQLIYQDQIVYIGLTSNPSRRLRQHQLKMRQARLKPKKRGLYSLADDQIELKVIAQTDSEYWAKIIECHQITEHLLAGHPLLNQQLGPVVLRRPPCRLNNQAKLNQD